MGENTDDRKGAEAAPETAPAAPRPTEEHQFEERKKGLDVLPAVNIAPEDAPPSGNLPPAETPPPEGGSDET